MDIILNHITKIYQGKSVLQNVNIRFAENQVNCIMGPSGEGKTTLLNILMGLIKPDGGSVEGLKGQRLSAVFQEDRLCEKFDAITNVHMVLDKYITKDSIINEFNKVGLTNYEGKPVFKLSGGMKRRIAIVRALLKTADIYILDEPLKGFDEELKLEVMNYMKEKLQGKTVIMVTHEKTEVEMFHANLILLSTSSIDTK